MTITFAGVMTIHDGKMMRVFEIFKYLLEILTLSPSVLVINKTSM